MFADFRALETVGMWMALRARKHQRAVLGTLARVMLVPWAGLFLWVFLMVTNAFNPSEDEFAIILVLWFGGGIVTDLVVSAKARVGLRRGLRYWAAGAGTGDRRHFQAPEPFGAVALHA